MAISCDPNSLLTQAKCFPCVPRGLADGVNTYLLCQWANKGGSTPTVPNAPTATAATQNYGYSLTATWSPPGAGPVPTGYKLSWNGGAYVDVGNVLSFNETGLTPNTAYHYTVKAYNGVGDSVASNQINVTSFHPSQLNPTLWLDAQDPGTITRVGTSVSAWNDKSASGNDFTQASVPNQPSYDPLIDFSLFFDGTQPSFMVGTAAGSAFGFSIFSVVSVDLNSLAGGSNVGSILACDGVTSDWYAFGTGAFNWYNFANDTRTDGTPIQQTTPCLLEMTNPGNAIPLLYFNGTLQTTIALHDSGGNSLSANTLVLGIADSVVQSFQFYGRMSEIIVFGAVLTDAQRVQVEQYLNQKWTLGF